MNLSKGPLAGVKIVEMVGLGPGPFVGMLLADLGADVIAIDRRHKGAAPQLEVDIHRRGKRSIVLDLKSPKGNEILLDLVRQSDAIFEGFRPGVMEKLGIGPEKCLNINSALVYGRMTGWGQDGPLANSAGHDLNYLSVTGAIQALGLAGQVPSPPLNLVGDYGAGVFLALGMVSAILHSRTTGEGQVIDASMVEGVNILMTLFHSLNASGMWNKQRSANFLDGGAHFYRCYQTADQKYISLGAIEKPFMKIFVELTGVDSEMLCGHMNPELWPERSQQLEALFKQKTQQEWCDLLEGSDACFAPVIPFWEAHEHMHNKERGSFKDVDGVIQPIPTPRFSATPTRECARPTSAGEHTEEILTSLGFSQAEVSDLFNLNIIA